MRAFQNMDEGDGVVGFAVWEQHVASELGADVRDFKSREYAHFKVALAELTERGYLSVVRGLGSGQRARMMYAITDEGEEWWGTAGKQLEGPRDDPPALPHNKWLSSAVLSSDSWRWLERDFKRGRIQIAIRSIERDEV